MNVLVQLLRAFHTVFRLRQVYGKDWAAIGHAMGRSPSSVKDRCRLLRDSCKTGLHVYTFSALSGIICFVCAGKWQADEEKRLTEIVQRLSGANKGSTQFTQ